MSRTFPIQTIECWQILKTQTHKSIRFYHDFQSTNANSHLIFYDRQCILSFSILLIETSLWNGLKYKNRRIQFVEFDEHKAEGYEYFAGEKKNCLLKLSLLRIETCSCSMKTSIKRHHHHIWHENRDRKGGRRRERESNNMNQIVPARYSFNKI